MIPEGLSFSLMFEVLGRNNLSMDYLILTLLEAHRLFIMGKAFLQDLTHCAAMMVLFEAE